MANTHTDENFVEWCRVEQIALPIPRTLGSGRNVAFRVFSKQTCLSLVRRSIMRRRGACLNLPFFASTF
jgi:hypothetical protein